MIHPTPPTALHHKHHDGQGHHHDHHHDHPAQTLADGPADHDHEDSHAEWLDELRAKREVDLIYVDPVAGVSGDMFLGALVDLGVDFNELAAGLESLKVPGFRLERRPVMRHCIACTKVDVIVEDEPQPHRHLADLLAIVSAAPLPEHVKSHSRIALTELAKAEARVHRMPVDEVHLHEVGGLDCLVDIVGTCLAVELLGADIMVSGPVGVGTGHVSCAHGRMPLPAPGTLALLEGFPIRRTLFEGEMTTPTGAALLSTLAVPTLDPITFVPRAVGYGAGTRDKPALANMLRVVRGTARGAALGALTL